MQPLVSAVLNVAAQYRNEIASWTCIGCGHEPHNAVASELSTSLIGDAASSAKFMSDARPNPSKGLMVMPRAGRLNAGDEESSVGPSLR
jgi:hypothetical protein